MIRIALVSVRRRGCDLRDEIRLLVRVCVCLLNYARQPLAVSSVLDADLATVETTGQWPPPSSVPSVPGALARAECQIGQSPSHLYPDGCGHLFAVVRGRRGRAAELQM